MSKFKKLLMVSAITGSLLFSSSLASAASFNDLSSFHWAKEEINYLVEHEIIKGYSDGAFYPEKTIKKAEAAIILARALDLKSSKSINFNDVQKNHSAYKEISAVVEAGIFPSSKEFKPNELVTREQMAEILVNAFKLKGSGLIEFKDVPKTSASYKAISILAENDITSGTADGTFKPKEKVTRAQFSVFMARALSPEFLPNQYNIPMNVNPVVKLFDYVLKNPEGVGSLLRLDQNIDFLAVSKAIKNIEVLEMNEIARLKGTTEFAVKLNIELGEEKQNLLKEGENQLYFLVVREGYMDYKIVSINQKPHLTGDDSKVTTEEAVSLFSSANKAYWYVVSGGEGKRDATTFTKDDLEYRYLAENLDSEEKLLTYLEKWYTPDQSTHLFKELGFITHKGKLAQPNADGGSILNWKKASTNLKQSSTTLKAYELKVPLGDLNEVETMKGELRFVPGKGWKVQFMGQ